MMAWTGFAIIAHVASCRESGGIVGKSARGRRASHAGAGETTLFVGAIWER